MSKQSGASEGGSSDRAAARYQQQYGKIAERNRRAQEERKKQREARKAKR